MINDKDLNGHKIHRSEGEIIMPVILRDFVRMDFV